MLSDLTDLMAKVENLSLDELLTLQEKIIQEVRVKAHSGQPDTQAGQSETPTTEQPGKVDALDLKVMNWDNWPADSTFRREDIYDDTGR